MDKVGVIRLKPEIKLSEEVYKTPKGQCFKTDYLNRPHYCIYNNTVLCYQCPVLFGDGGRSLFLEDYI